ncbi:MAG: flagellar basal body-associated FliL family protein [Calditrichota bacterium]
MADKEPLEQEQTPPEEQPAEGQKKLPLPKWAIIAVVLLAQVAGAYYLQKTFIFSNDASASEVETKHEKAKKESSKHGEEKGGESDELPIVMLEEIVVNPAETAGRRYLAVTMGLQANDAESVPVIEKRQALVRDALISLLSSKYLDQLSSIQYRDSLKLEIKDAVNKQLSEELVSNVIFTSYVLQ